MSTGASALSTAPPSADVSSPPPKRFRVSLSRIQSLTAQGKAKLSPGEIHLFEQRGFLKHETASQALATINESATAGSAPAATTTLAIPQLPSSPSHKDSVSPTPEITATAIMTPMATMETTLPNRVFRTSPIPKASGAKHDPFGKDAPRIERTSISKQSHPPFHNQVFMDTCSHLHPRREEPAAGPPGSSSPMDISTSFRRHSESTTITSARYSVRSASISAPSSYWGTLAPPSAVEDRASPTSTAAGQESLSSATELGGHHQRRTSHSPVAPIVSSPEGYRTVLYAAASPALTLYSLPTTAIEEISFSPPTTHTAAMDQFKFPAVASSPNLLHPASTLLQDPSTSNGSLLSQPISPMATPSSSSASIRSKRKSSIPIRSPSWVDSRELSPGVIFQMPFGFPRSTKSPSLAGSDDSMMIASTTPPSHYPSPAASIQHSASGSANDALEPPSGLFDGGRTTPASPIARAGLGIRVQEDFSEPRATHPLDQPISSRTTTLIGDSTMDTEDGRAASAASAAAAAAAATTVMEVGQDCMPTPPSMAPVLDSRVGGEGTSDTLGTLMNDAAAADVETTTSMESVGSDSVSVHHSISDDTHRAPASAAATSTTAHDDEFSFLPLWAQRQRNIRRQSLIPRSELDFVKGSGILPPPSTDLVIPGGARIMAYPPLLSDIVKYQEELEAKNMEQELEMTALAAAANGAKRRKAVYGKGRGSISAQGTRNDDGPDANDHQRGDQMDSIGGKRRRYSHAQDSEAAEEMRVVPERQGVSSRYRRHAQSEGDHDSFSPSNSPPARDDAAQQQHKRHTGGRAAMLGSPVDITLEFEHLAATIAGRGTKGNGKQMRTSAAGRQNYHQREMSWDDAHGMEHRHRDLRHGGLSDSEGAVSQRRGSINSSSTSAYLTSGKGKSKKGIKTMTTPSKKTGWKNSNALDLNDSDGDYGASTTRFRRGSFDKNQVSDSELPGMHGRAYQFKTLKPLLKAIQSEDEAADDSFREQRLSKDNGGAKRVPANQRAAEGLKANRKRSIQEDQIDMSTSPSKRAKNVGASKKKLGAGGPSRRGRTTGETLGRFDESMAMAEALMEMHDGMVDDDETEDEFESYRGDGGYHAHSSDSQDDQETLVDRTMKQRQINSNKNFANQKRIVKPSAASKTSKATGASKDAALPKKKKPTLAGSGGAGDPTKTKQQNKRRESTSGAGHHGGHPFDEAGQGPAAGAGSKRCEACDVTDTPCWRPGYSSNTSLCNSCGLRYKKCNVFCTREDCKYIPLKMEFTAMEEDRIRQGRDHLICVRCKGRVALPP
ncbi:DNA-binding transcription repressor [Dissophora globulifera]|nr:DNA-binding transcription repressor [Dissophora globulifera]